MKSYQLWWAPDAFGLIRKEEETSALILDKTADFKEATICEFRNVAEIRRAMII